MLAKIGPSMAQALKFELVGGSLCLDFANTVSGRRGTATQADQLSDYGGLLSWAAQAGVLSRIRALELEKAAPRYGTRAAQIFRRSIALREAIFAIFSALAAGKNAPPAAMEVLNNEVVEAMNNARIVPKAKGFDWQLPPEPCGLFLPLHAIARDAAELLTSRLLKEVRECSSERCSWLFLDETRNHSRLWCEMRVCGNRAKQTRFRDRSAKKVRTLSRQNKSRARR